MMSKYRLIFFYFLTNALFAALPVSSQSEAMSRPKILVTHPEVPQVAIDLMKKSFDVIMCKSVPPKRTEILEKAKGVDGLFWACHEPINAEVLNVVGPQLKAISTMSAGLDYVDIAELKKRKIPLGHTPVVLNNAVADLAIGLMIAAARRFQEGRQKIDNSQWENYHLQWMLGQNVENSVVGFYGFGGIGQAIAKRLKGFEIDQILYTTRNRIHEDLEEEFNAKKVDFNQMLRESDFIFISAPLTKETQGVFNASAFDMMKKNAVLVNIARGPIVNQDDLYEALKSNQIFAAGLDVMTPEPLSSSDKLLSLPNCVVIPHLGSATLKTRTDMAYIAAHNVMAGIAGEPMFAPAYGI